ncbi:MAG: sugar phosphate isomerase/epimerase [Bryobacterales bacterium]|nr:sugar phosphate isomerase/epimerase [Bryobacterales bacterium]
MRRREFLATLGAAALSPLAKAGVGTVEFGVCADAAHFDAAVSHSFDYYEMEVAEIDRMDDARFAALKAQVLASPIRCRAYRSLIRRFQLVGETAAAQQSEMKAYLEKNLERCSQLGGRVVVWGSGGSRNVPPGFSRDRAWAQIQEYLHTLGDIAKKNNLVIGIEPLRRQESNIINSAGEALKLAREVNHPNIKIIVDYYHLRQENEDAEIVRTARNEIVHLHFANPTGRRWPHEASEDSEYKRFFSLVKEIGYKGGLSIEGNGTFEEDADASLRFFRQMLAG